MSEVTTLYDKLRDALDGITEGGQYESAKMLSIVFVEDNDEFNGRSPMDARKDKAIAKIMQSFADEGYSTSRDRDGMKFMTGQMFYDRFEREIDFLIQDDHNQSPYRKGTLSAAHRAAGLSDEGYVQLADNQAKQEDLEKIVQDMVNLRANMKFDMMRLRLSPTPKGKQ